MGPKVILELDFTFKVVFVGKFKKKKLSVDHYTCPKILQDLFLRQMTYIQSEMFDSDKK